VTAQSASGLVGENKPDQTLRRRHRVGVGDSESTSPEIEDFWCADESRSDSSTSAESQSDSDVRTRASLSLTPAETALPVDSLAESVKCVRQTASGGLSDTSDNVVETGSLGVVRKTESSVMTRDEVSRTTCPRGTSPPTRTGSRPRTRTSPITRSHRRLVSSQNSSSSGDTLNERSRQTERRRVG
jgi:hypothetical protein